MTLNHWKTVVSRSSQTASLLANQSSQTQSRPLASSSSSSHGGRRRAGDQGSHRQGNNS